MRRADVNEVIHVRFEEVNQRHAKGRLGCGGAADIRGISVSTFYRMRGRHVSQGLDGLCDQRIGKLPARRAPP